MTEYGKYGRYVDAHGVQDALKQALKTKGQALLQGETGTGKTFLVHKLCDNEDRAIEKLWAELGLNVPELVKISAHEEQSYYDYVAQDILIAGETKTREQIIPLWLRKLATPKTPRIFLIDEANFLPPSVMGFMHPILDWQKELWVPELSKFLERTNLHWCVLCVNPWEKSIYQGTKEMNAAFKSRLLCINVPYMEVDDERDWLMEQFPDIASAEIKKLVSFANRTREAYRMDLLYAPVTPRNVLDVLNIMREFKVSSEEVKHFFFDAALPEQVNGLQGLWEGKDPKTMGNVMRR